ncbi:hypothetical protein DITRI_Ditri09bG0031000 [Diplodiscus trichospermus]
MARRFWYKEILPGTAMVTVECTNVVLSILLKAASSKGNQGFLHLSSLSSLDFAFLVLLGMELLVKINL